MSEDSPPARVAGAAAAAGRASRLLGSLRDALLAVGREEPAPVRRDVELPAADPTQADLIAAAREPVPKLAPIEPQLLSAAEAARRARGADLLLADSDAVDIQSARAFHGVSEEPSVEDETEPVHTQLVRGKVPVRRGAFEQDPVAGWLVVVGGPGLGCYRPIFEGNNAIGRAPTQRIPLDFGDEAISSEEQAYIRYDSSERSFLFVPNLAKTNVVSVNDTRPTVAVELQHMDVITIGRTQLVFVPFCGAEFDWSDLAEAQD